MKFGNGAISTALLVALPWFSAADRFRGSSSERSLQACATVPTGTYYHLLSKISGLALSVSGGATSNGANVVQSAGAPSEEDNWSFVPTSNGYYRIVAEHSGLNLGVQGASTANSGNVIQSTANNGSTEWCFVDVGAGVYQIVNRNSGKVLDVANYSTSDGGNIHQWASTGVDNQLWSLGDTSATGPSLDCGEFSANTIYRIKAKHSGLSLGVTGSSTISGANVAQVATSSGANDNWRFVAQSNGHYHVLVQHSGLALGVAGDGNGANVVQLAPSQDGTTDWCFIDQGNGEYSVRNRKSSVSLDVEGSSGSAGANIHLWTFWGGDNQKFTVELANEGPAPPVNPTPVPPPPPPPVNPTPVPPPPPPPSGGTNSDWIGPINTPVIAVAAVNLPNGNIVMWSAYLRDMYGGDGGTQTWTATYNPSTGSLTEKLVKTNHDMFCPGTATLADGRIMITGGSNSEATTFYNYKNNAWTVGPKMKISRGYHSMTVLADGRVLTIGGSWSGGWANKDGEIWSPSNSWSQLSGIPDDPFVTNDNAGFYRSDNHFWLFLAPNGKVFHAGPSKTMNWATTTGNGSVQGSVNRGNDNDAMNGNALMFDIGKILTVGGAPHYDSGSASNRAYVIDINGSEAKVTRSGNMQYRRCLHNSVLLPSGEVVVIGGRESPGDLFSDKNSILHAEIWSPSTGQFRTLKQMDVPRNYHSVALLMKVRQSNQTSLRSHRSPFVFQDGRVWAAGGGLCGGCSANHQDMEIMVPPYLYNGDGSLATRPVIASAPSTVKAGGTISVGMDSNQNHSFALVRISAVTHSVNNDQRRIPLTVQGKSGSSFTLKLPANKNVSLVGVYYLFAMNQNGVPSVAKDIRIAL